MYVCMYVLYIIINNLYNIYIYTGSFFHSACLFFHDVPREKNVQPKHEKASRTVQDWHAAIGTISEMKRLGTRMIDLSEIIDLNMRLYF